MKHSLETIKAYAKTHRVPIMSDDSIAFVSDVLNEYQAAQILEIGAAIGFSSSALALNDPKRHIVSLERDDERVSEALVNVNGLGLSNRVQIVHADAHTYRVKQNFDALIIDASKAQNRSFFRLYFAYTDKVCIIDNVDYHGFVSSEGFESIHSRRLRQMVRKIQEFKTYLEGRSDLVVSHHDVGDGMLVVRRK